MGNCNKGVLNAKLGPIMFTLYMLLGNIIQNHSTNVHCFADDRYFIYEGRWNRAKLQACLIKTWMSTILFLLNSSKKRLFVVPKILGTD